MSAFNIYLSYPTREGYSEFIDVTDDALETTLGSIQQALEANEFDTGQITFDNIKIELRNDHSKYSEAANPLSVFPYKRDESIVKIEWDVNSYGLACGDVSCGLTVLSTPRQVFKGLLEDNSSDFTVFGQTITFKILALDSIINKTSTPYSSLSVADDAETTLFKILDQDRVKQFFTVDALNISLPNNFTPDDISSLANTTILEAIQEILKLGNAVMFVRNDIVYIRSREVDPTSSFIFYGPSSSEGIENILNIKEYTPGLNRCFNYITWKDTSLVLSFADSIDTYGERKKEIDSPLITDDVKRLAVLNTYLFEFGFPRIEAKIEAPLTTPIVDLTFLNKINIDYPAEILPSLGEEVARYGQAIYGKARYARARNSLFISINQEWKILNININTRAQKVTFKVREV